MRIRFVSVGIGWGFNAGPLRVGGSFRGFPMPSLPTLLILVIVAWLLEVAVGLLSLLGKAFVYVFSFNGRDETYALIVFVVIYLLKLRFLAGYVGKRWLRPLFVLPGCLVFAVFWNQIPLVDPDLTGFPGGNIAQEFFNTTLIGFASFGMWLIAFSAAIGTSMTLLIGIKILSGEDITRKD